MNKHNSVLKIFAALLIITAISACKKEANDKLNISYEKYSLPNGLQVILHTDHSDPVISYDIMYHVGSSREIPGKTGFAHLFEHLLKTCQQELLTRLLKVLEDQITDSLPGI
jgi:zinc protease